MNIYSDIQFSNDIVLNTNFFNDKTEVPSLLLFLFNYYSFFVSFNIFIQNLHTLWFILFSLPQIFPNPTYALYSRFSWSFSPFIHSLFTENISTQRRNIKTSYKNKLSQIYKFKITKVYKTKHKIHFLFGLGFLLRPSFFIFDMP